MKKYLLLLIVALQSLLWSGQAAAASCVSASLAAYLSLGSGGCTVGNLLFTDFSLNGLTEDAVDFPGIVLNPTGSGAFVGFNFTFVAGAGEAARPAAHTDATAPSGTIFEDRIGFKVTGTGVNLNAATITLNGAGVTGDGNVSAVQDLCRGGTFVDPKNTSSCSPGSTADSQAVVFITGVPELTTSTVTFAAVSMLSVLNDIVVDAGLPRSTATLASLTSLFSSQPRVVPEPDSLLLLGVGLAVLLMRRAARREGSSPIA